MTLTSLSKSYNRQDVLDDLSKFLTSTFEEKNQNLPLVGAKYDSITKASYLGKSSLFSVFEIQHCKSSDARVTLTKQAVSLMKDNLLSRALFFFVPEDKKTFRISLVTVDWAHNKQASNPRRYSFLVGEGQKVRTAIQQLSKPITNEEDLLKRFSIEVVNDEFYKKISEHFEDLLKTIKYPNVCQQDKQEEAKRNFAVRLIGRLIFCWFLKKKLRQDGSALIPEDLLSSRVIEKYENYYHEILEPLFFETLNKQPQNRIPKCRTGLFEHIPFLNGGLFEAHDPEDGYKYDEKTETCYLGMAIDIPNSWFIKFFETLETYNFTIDENTSTDIDLAVDPEMLGRIFENLLASINPETKESVRKATGSYYTPREIVDYMVTQSLKQYLYTKTDIAHTVIDSLFEFEPQVDGLSALEKQEIYKALSTVKVLDPAVGSGAFPMGVLQKIMSIIHIIDPKGDIYRGLSDSLLTSNLTLKQLDYVNKYALIRDCIYGIDIQPMAIEICRLRFFLTLIVEEESDNPKPLPNLNFNFACANSLVGLEQPKQEAELFSQRTELIEELKRIRKAYFNSSAEEKERLKQNFDTIQHLIWLRTFHTEKRYLMEDRRFKLSEQQTKNKEYADELSSWNPFSYQSNRWFDPFWMFGVEDGFDIVIANPPYIIEKGHKDIFTPVKNSVLKQFYRGKMDFSYFFFHLALNLLKNNGICTFITENSYITATGGCVLRKDFKDRAAILNLINFNELKIFKSALGQYNMITLLQKTNNKDAMCSIIDVKRRGILSNVIFDAIIAQTDTQVLYHDALQNNLYEGEECYIRMCTEDSHSVLFNILSKIQKTNEILGDICCVNTGIMGGCDFVNKKNIRYIPNEEKILQDIQEGDGVFVLDNTHSRDLVQIKNFKNTALLQPFFKNSDIKKYYTSDQFSKFIVFSSDSCSDEQQKIIQKNLQRFKGILQKIRQINNESLAKWHILRRGASHPNIFTIPKIVAPQRSPENTFGYNETEWYASADVYFITAPKNGYKLKYILALLNSKLYYVWLYNKGKRKGDNLELYQTPLSEIPIKKAEDKTQNEFVSIVDKILSITQSDDYLSNSNKQSRVKAYQDEIDQMVYKLYGLTDEEIKIVEESQPKKKS
ncbi:MAG: Eco57I restriction-modification methylase domain-containing protein [Candidatus Avelusimicrobium sp.]|uniref:Eco57I restriction-modification methylase domain-containing protein n=1 Tax=Candidatus Avelusimicrobium sp. TaxID=3048833 RepID=UPI003F05F653